MIETLSSLIRDSTGFDPASEQRDFGGLASARIGSSLYNLLSIGTSTYTGRPVSPQVAMTYGAVYACVAKISKSVASCPMVTYRNASTGKRPADNDYRYRMLMEEPNSEMSAFQWVEAIVSHLLLWGNHYSFLDWDGAGRLRAAWPLEPGYVQVMRTQVGGSLIYRYFPHNPYSVPVAPGIYQAQNILHVPYLGFDGLMGYSPITLSRQGIALGLAAEEYAGRFFANGGKPPYWIEYPGDIKDRGKFMEEYRAVHAGLENAGKTTVLWGGMKAHELKMSPEDAQYMEGRQFQVAEICRIFDMPQGMMGDPGGKATTYASSEQSDIQYAKHTISPICARIEKKVNITVLGSQDSLTCRFDLRQLYRADMKTIAESHQVEIQSGKITPNEARAESDMNPGPAVLDQHFMQMQMQPVGTPPQPTTAPIQAATKPNGAVKEPAPKAIQ